MYKDRADYGKYLIDRLSNDLNIGSRELYRIVRFYKLYEIVTTVSSQLSWSHYIELIDIHDKKRRDFYQNNAILNSWSVKELRKQIRNNLYRNTSLSNIEKTLSSKLPAIDTHQIFKDTYNFTFIEYKETNSERDIENKIMDNLITFLKELGPDFYIGDQQAPIKIDGKTHYIDLVLYNRAIPCVVLVDLKNGALDSRDVGQMNKYINYYRQNRQYEHEKDTIGLIICKEAGREEVMYALGGLEEKIFIATYKVKLPDEDKIKRIIRET